MMGARNLTSSRSAFFKATSFKGSVASVKGVRNAENQDSYMTLPELGVFVLCDGMGGHAGGRVASQLIVNTLYHTLEDEDFENLETFESLESQQKESQENQESLRQIERASREALSIDYLKYLIGYSNRVVYHHAIEHLKLRGMGSTLVLAWIDENQLQLYHVGDSRAYRLRDYCLTRLTEDHASTNGKGISRALGVKSTVEIEHHSWDWQAEDQLLLISDGISDVLEDVHLTNLLVETFGSMADKLAALIKAAITAGGDDDKTAILLQTKPSPRQNSNPIK